MKEKSFLSYEKQIELLMLKGLIIEDKEKAIKLLEKYSYFTLINGYKEPFKGKDNDYKKNTRIEDIYSLYEYDDALRHIFIKYICLVELHIKSLISYCFCEKYGNEQSNYQNVANYDYTNCYYQKGINELVDLLSKRLADENSPAYMRHYVNKHNNVPLWVVIKTLTFGNVSKMYKYQCPEIQSKICHNFKDVDEGQLSNMLDILTRYRNVCAHNERLFDFKYKKGHLRTTKYHEEFNILTNKRYINLFEVVISLKMLLDENDFNNLVRDISEELKKLSANTNQIQRAQLLKLMGFPNGWERIIEIK